MGIDCSCFSLGDHHFSTRTCAEKMLWLRAISNVKAQLVLGMIEAFLSTVTTLAAVPVAGEAEAFSSHPHTQRAALLSCSREGAAPYAAKGSQRFQLRKGHKLLSKAATARDSDHSLSSDEGTHCKMSAAQDKQPSTIAGSGAALAASGFVPCLRP